MATPSTLSKSERTRRFIIEKAAPLFNKKGYADTSLLDVIEVTGLSKGAIYGNFSNKDELALEVFAYNVSVISGPLRQEISLTKGAVNQLLTITSFYRRIYEQVAKKGGCPLLNTATEADDNYPPLKKRVQQSLTGYRENISRIICDGQAQKEIRSNLKADDYATIFLAMIEGGILLAKANRDPHPLYTLLDKIDNMILHELKA